MSLNSKSSILLVKLPPWEVNFPPLGVAYLSAYLERHDMEVKVLDLNLEIYKNISPEIRDAWKNNDYFYWQTDKMRGEFENMISWIVDRILSFETKVVGFSMTISSCNLFKDIIVKLKNASPEKIVVVGGPFTAWKEFRGSLGINKNFVEYFVIGEGEVALHQILRHINRNGEHADIKLPEGFLVWKDDPSDYTVCVQGPAILKLDEIPFPTYNGFDIDSYDRRFISILGSRGCVRRCSFCNDTVMWGKPFRLRSPENIVEEMKYCVNKYKTEVFKFCDLMLNGSIDFITRLSELLIKEDLRVYGPGSYPRVVWHGQVAVRKDMDFSLFKKMMESGFTVASVGVESFSNKVLRLMNKGYVADEAVQFLRYHKEAGIEVQINTIVGFPGETEDDLKETMDYIKKASPYIDYVASISTCGVGPGSDLYTDPEKFNIDIKDHFYWYTKDGKNDIYIRMQRYKRLLDFLKKENIRILGVSELDSMEQLLKERGGKGK
ncbi:MAG: radical SAM protein [Candidatus Omnitrophica bacterium]|nr:radical SAM protein [Candidatus Omnitrophota bacterium]